MGNVRVAPLVLLLGASAASLFTCIWLLLKLWPGRKTGRLFARELFHLALADILSAVGVVLYAVRVFADFPGTAIESHLKVDCKAQLWIVFSGTYISSFFEAHIALGFFCAFSRNAGLVRCLDRTITWIWPLGFILAFVSVCFDVQTSELGNTCEQKTGIHGIAGEVVYIMCFVIALVAYVETCRRVLCSESRPSGVERRVWQSALIYPLSFFGTQGPMIAYFLSPDRIRSHEYFLIWALTINVLNGVFNVLTYTCNSRYLHSGLARNKISHSSIDNTTLKNFISFHVGFDPSQLVSEHTITEVLSQSSSAGIGRTPALASVDSEQSSSTVAT